MEYLPSTNLCFSRVEKCEDRLHGDFRGYLVEWKLKRKDKKKRKYLTNKKRYPNTYYDSNHMSSLYFIREYDNKI